MKKLTLLILLGLFIVPAIASAQGGMHVDGPHWVTFNTKKDYMLTDGDMSGRRDTSNTILFKDCDELMLCFDGVGWAGGTATDSLYVYMYLIDLFDEWTLACDTGLTDTLLKGAKADSFETYDAFYIRIPDSLLNFRVSIDEDTTGTAPTARMFEHGKGWKKKYIGIVLIVESEGDTLDDTLYIKYNRIYLHDAVSMAPDENIQESDGTELAALNFRGCDPYECIEIIPLEDSEIKVLALAEDLKAEEPKIIPLRL